MDTATTEVGTTHQRRFLIIIASSACFVGVLIIGIVLFLSHNGDFSGTTISDVQNLYNANQFTDAIATGEKLLAQNPNDVNALLSLATTWAQRGSFEGQTDTYGATALSYAQKVLAIDPQNAEAYRVIGYVYETRGNVTQAEETYQHALSLAQNPGLLYLDLGRLNEEQGNTGVAYTYYLKAQAEGTNPGLTYLSLGRIFIADAAASSTTAASSTVAAMDALSRAHIWAENVRVKAEASYLLGTLALKAENIAEAETQMKASVADDSTYPLGHVGLAETYLKLLPSQATSKERSAMVSLALKELQSAIQINPNQTLAYVLAGNIYSGIGDIQNAKAAFEKAKEVIDTDRSLTTQGKTDLREVITSSLGSALSQNTGIAGVPARALTAGSDNFTIACTEQDCGIIVPPTVTTTTTTTTTTTVADTGTAVASACVPPTTTTTTVATNSTSEGFKLSDRTINVSDPNIVNRSFGIPVQYGGNNGPTGCVATKKSGGRGGGGGIVYQSCAPDIVNAQYLCDAKGYVWGVESFTQTEASTMLVCTRAPEADGYRAVKKTNLNTLAADASVTMYSNVDQSAWTCVNTSVKKGGGRGGGSLSGTPQQVMDTVVCNAPPQGTFFIANECNGGQCLWGNNPTKASIANRKTIVDNTSTYLCRMRGYETFVDYWSRPKTSTRQGNASPKATPYPSITPMTPAQIMAAAPGEVTVGGDPSCTSNCWYRIGVVSCKLPAGSFTSTNSSTNLPASCNLPVTAKLTASKNSVTANSPVTLSYTSTNATTCALDQGIGTLPTVASGSTVVTPTQDTTYVLTCTGPGGVGIDRQTITIANAPPTVNFYADPTSVLLGQDSTVNWSSPDATSCTGSGFSTAGKTSGAASVTPPESSNYSVTCTNANGSTTKNTGITVFTPTAQISSSAARAKKGDTVTISWSAENVAACTISGAGLVGPNGEQGSFSQTAAADGSISGSQDVVVNAESQYLIVCTPSGTGSSNATTVTLAPDFQEF